MSQRRNECHGHPMAARSIGPKWLAFGPPAMSGRHVGFGPGFVDEDQPLGRYALLIFSPLLSPVGDIGPILLAGEDGFF